ncbi:MAG: hypothetical protein M1133_08370 [Armatimonadetes bacterium]|nr:hypothetical protein [Armatimonadota bacterium]
MRSPGRHLRPLGIADILDETADLYKRNFALLVGIAAVIYVPYFLMDGLLAGGQSGIKSGGGLSVLLTILFVFLMEPIVTGTLTLAISERYLGRTSSIGGCYRRILSGSVLWPFIGAVFYQSLVVGAVFLVSAIILAVFAVVLGISTFAAGAGRMVNPVTGGLVIIVVMLVALVPPIIVRVKLALMGPVVILEGKRAGESLGRSWSLMSGFVGKGFWLFVIATLVVVMITYIIVGPTFLILYMKKMHGADAANSIRVIHTILWTAINTVMVPITSIVAILLYYDVRIRKEGFDLELLARELDERVTAEDSRGIASLPQEQLRPPEDVDRQ